MSSSPPNSAIRGDATRVLHIRHGGSRAIATEALTDNSDAIVVSRPTMRIGSPATTSARVRAPTSESTDVVASVVRISPWMSKGTAAGASSRQRVSMSLKRNKERFHCATSFKRTTLALREVSVSFASCRTVARRCGADEKFVLTQSRGKSMAAAKSSQKRSSLSWTSRWRYR